MRQFLQPLFLQLMVLGGIEFNISRWRNLYETKIKRVQMGSNHRKDSLLSMTYRGGRDISEYTLERLQDTPGQRNGFPSETDGLLYMNYESSINRPEFQKSSVHSLGRSQ